jgi:hypothetical protein
MATKRTPLRRSGQQRRITPEAVALFKEMEALECTCPPRDWEGEYWKHEQCQGCDKWFDLHSRLHDEVGAQLWEWPCIRNRDDPNPYPENCYAAELGEKARAENTAAYDLYDQLFEAAGLG